MREPRLLRQAAPTRIEGLAVEGDRRATLAVLRGHRLRPAPDLFGILERIYRTAGPSAPDAEGQAICLPFLLVVEPVFNFLKKTLDGFLALKR